jgi:hypothetical protein
MKVSTAIFRRAKRDGRNPSTGARTKSLEEKKKEAEKKRQKMKSESPGD